MDWLITNSEYKEMSKECIGLSGAKRQGSGDDLFRGLAPGTV
jgi:hypothetical protein